MTMTPTIPEHKLTLREQLKADYEEYLRNGGRTTECDIGESNKPLPTLTARNGVSRYTVMNEPTEGRLQ